MVPILFTLGVIGWGFFVIDRLTKPPQEKLAMAEQPARVNNVSVSQNKTGWKNSLLDFVDKFDKKKSVEKKTKENSLSIIDEKKSSFIQQYSPVKENTSAKIQEQTTEQLQPMSQQQSSHNSADVQIYFFRYEGDEYPKLVAVKRTLNSFTNEQDFLTKTFRYVIAGPNANERSSFVDSFPVKPIVHNVQKMDDTLLLNFNEDFGRGVSFPMLQLQLEQLLKTATTFQGVHNITIAINGKPQSYVGGDGLAIPDVINQETLTSLKN